jgi:hypothetical protein
MPEADCDTTQGPIAQIHAATQVKEEFYDAIKTIDGHIQLTVPDPSQTLISDGDARVTSHTSFLDEDLKILSSWVMKLMSG